MIRLSLTLLLAAAAPAAAEPFVLLIHESPDQIALRADAGAAGQAYWGAYAAWGAEAAAAGVMKGGAAMVPVPVATVGTMAPGALVLGGFFQIEAASVADAQAWAAKLPAAETGAIEVRALVQMPGM
ncbi:MAG: YciI family protein [Gemmobacter sp.]